LAEHIEASEEPLRALVVLAGNPLLSVGGGERLAGALRSLDLLVSIDLYRNATGELADYVLPATDQFEREDLNTFVQGIQGVPFVQWTARVVEPDAEQRQEWQILGGLLEAMGKRAPLPLDTVDPITMLDRAIAPSGVTIAALREAGGVLPLPEPGPGGSFERIGLAGTLELVPEALRPALDRGNALFRELSAEQTDGFKLITRRTRNTLNSWLQNLPSAAPPDEPNPLWMNPSDGDRLGVAQGDRVQITNGYGTVEAGVRFDPRLRAGVVAMTHGFGNAATSGMTRARARPGVNVNALAPHGPGTFDPVGGMSHVTGIPVDLRPLDRAT
jgi:anaerobic selenocysteine-containing dehydrogenase